MQKTFRTRIICDSRRHDDVETLDKAKRLKSSKCESRLSYSLSHYQSTKRGKVHSSTFHTDKRANF